MNLKLKILLFAACVFCTATAFGQQVNKIQRAIDAIKMANSNESDDYITDGQRTVWVKSYKHWIPEDFIVMKKERPIHVTISWNGGSTHAI